MWRSIVGDGSAAKLVAQGSGQLIKGILWCGDVSVERLKRGNEVLKQRMATETNAEISPETLKRIKRNGVEAAKVASEGLDVAERSIGTAWTVFKVRKALNPKSSFNRATQLKSSAKAAVMKKAKGSKY